MKCINKKLIISLSCILMASLYTACGNAAIRMPFSDFNKSHEDTFNISSYEELMAEAFAENIAVEKEDVLDIFSLDDSSAGILVDVKNKDILYQQNAFKTMYPASLTKIMTALLVLENSNLDDTVTCTSAVKNIAFNDAVLLNLNPGDTMTVDQALHLMLINSYNDVAIALACHVSGTEEAFNDLMNKRALELGATHTHFNNSHGLPDEEHVTCVHDLYLIFNELIKYDKFKEIIQLHDYSTVYHDNNGNDINATANTTNAFFRGIYDKPENVTILGGKTGTTTDAGFCLMLLSQDKYGNSYISVILNEDSRDSLYGKMSELLGELK